LEVSLIIWLASYPRSGNTYFRVLLKQYFGISTFSAYEDKVISKNSQIQAVVGHEGRSRSIESLADDEKIYLVKTHDLPQGDNMPAIYLVRDGRDALVSYAHYTQSYENHTDSAELSDNFYYVLHDLIVYNASFGGWGSHVLGWTNRASPSAIIKFEALVQSDKPWELVAKALEEVNYPTLKYDKGRAIPSFKELHQQMPGFFREGKIGTWKNEMPEDLHEIFWQQHKGAMDKMGYNR